MNTLQVPLPVGKVCVPDGQRTPKKINLTMIVAMARNGVIGSNGKIPWYVPEDLSHFKNITFGCECVVGRKTHESIVERLGKPLPGRNTKILTRDKKYHFPGCAVISEKPIETILQIATYKKVFVIGGGEIYKMFMPYATEIIVSYIDIEVAGDTYFPPIGDEWHIDSSEDRWCPKSDKKFKIVRYLKV